MIGTTAAAAALGVSPRRVLQLITEGTLAAQQVAGVWIIDERSLDAARQRRPARPPLVRLGGVGGHRAGVGSRTCHSPDGRLPGTQTPHPRPRQPR